MVLPEAAPSSVPSVDPAALDERSTGASGMRLKVATRPATVGATWHDFFQPGTPSQLSLEARVRVVADIAGALIQIHENTGVPRQHRRHGRLTPRHVLVGVDGSASLFNAKEPFSKLLPSQPDLGYLAPELLTQTGPATQQTDVFSMGVLLWEALDNGRLFPHRRAAAISRLIARRSLQEPRIQEEWAIPLAGVAMRALSESPDARYSDATALWLALREHLPAPDVARAALSRAAQQALKLELTSDIRDAPPYLVSPEALLRTSVPPERGSPLDPPLEGSARYSLQPEPSTRQPTRPAPAITLPAPAVRAPIAEAPQTVAGPLSPRPGLPAQLPRSEPPTVRAQPAARPVPVSLPVPNPNVATLQVNLPRDLVDSALPLYVSSRPPQKAFPWGALSFAALVFFGVGAAVAFGAVTALRGPTTPDGVAARPFAVEAMPASPAPTRDVPPVITSSPSQAAATGSGDGSPMTVEDDPAAPPEAAAEPDLDVTAPVTASEPAATAIAEGSETPPRAVGPKTSRNTKSRAKRAKPKKRASKPQAKGSRSDGPDVESLPVVEQPY